MPILIIYMCLLILFLPSRRNSWNNVLNQFLSHGHELKLNYSEHLNDPLSQVRMPQ